ncbi:MAG: RND transporter [Alphaproteobacteria bacterium 64-11]|nr:efflux RND transporter permease subunit [Alphaproteobacteria bacterium]OJU11824.1 MAG: RND transporter [Alphaproteobacteria bacterium 64-11]
MTWIVKIALDRPYTFIVMALMILIFGPLAAVRTPTDIFPDIGIPVLGVAFTYSGLSPDEMGARLMANYERILSTTVNDIEHVESQSMPGIGIAKIYFQPDVDIRLATAQVTSISQTATRMMPPGTQPPLILNYSASTVPVLQLAFSSKSLSEQQVLDLSQNFARPRLATVRGAAIPYSYGGKFRSVLIDLDPAAMQARGLSATDVQNAFVSQNQIVPAGNVKIGSYQYVVKLNNAADTIGQMNEMPVKTANGGTVFLHDVAHVRDGNSVQQNIVHVDGNRAVLSTILKHGNASTLDVVQGIKNLLPLLRQQLPDALKIDILSDQSLFVKAAVSGVAREGAIAAALTSIMILLFLGSWRSTVIIATSIPLAVLCALIGLWATGQTLNIMTLGGLALAVGILVDDATVTIENINWHLEQGKSVYDAIMDGARQIVQPAFVSLLCICVAFVPMFSLTGIAGYLFVPMALSVVYAMIASFVLSRTLVPTLSLYLLKPHRMDAAGHHEAPPNLLGRVQRHFEDWFMAVRESYRNLLALAMTARKPFVIGFLAMVAASMLLIPFLGEDLFPAVDSGQITLHARTPTGTRVEDTTQIVAHIEQEVRRIIPRAELATIVDNVGLNMSPINLIYNNSGTVGLQDSDIFITLNENHGPTADYVRTMRERLPRLFPAVAFSFPPPDITSQILNFGAPAPLDVQISGTNQEATAAFGQRILRQMRTVPGIADARMQQSSDMPRLNVAADRSRMAQVGLTERDVTNALATSLAGTSQSAPNFWLNPRNGVSYSMTAQTPEYKIDSLAALQNLPVTGAGATTPQVLGGLITLTRGQGPAVVTHYNIQPTIDLFATTQDRDLGAVAADVQKIIDANRKFLPRGATVTLRGQITTMKTAFSGLTYGLMAAVLLIYLLIVVNFQSWTDPFVIITALPAALAGIVWMLFATGTTLSVPALTGAIMCMGVATANSILVIAFARERLAVHGDAVLAAVEAGVTRFRPVVMTALAMIIGMSPMAIGLGEGAEQNAPLGRAVIGGLVFATCATLIFVPVVFSILHERKARRAAPSTEAGEAYA